MITQALLVDDSRSVLDLLKRLVEADDSILATGFLDPLEALNAARRNDFDIVLVDYEMPKMDGISFIRELRSLPQFSDIPVVMITSIQTDEVRLKALEAGATDFLPKRPQARELSVRLRNLIKLGRRPRRQLRWSCSSISS
jgi:putative two-component system response regulator